MDFDKLHIASDYAKTRSLYAPAVRIWQGAILKYVKSKNVKNVLDLGCGTGRFIPFLKNLFPEAKILGADPSKEMLRQAYLIKDDAVSFIQEGAENLSAMDSSQDLVFMSMAYHALNNPVKAAKEIYRLLRLGGFLVIKQGTKESTNAFFYKFFPESYKIAKTVLPKRRDLESNFKQNGFRLVGHELISYPTAKNVAEYYESISHRGSSNLKMLPDKVFNRGIKVMESYSKLHGDEGPVMGIKNLFVFQKP